jgi:uncharacterized protein YndB with AHSA1/START domain
MNMEAKSKESETQAITVEYELAHPPAKVWRALSEPALLAAWLMENDIRAVVGHRFTFKSKPIPGWDGIVHCQVLEADAPHKLSYSWRGGSAPFGIDTVLTLTLLPTAAGGTRLLLEHDGFLPANTMAFEGIAKGWRGKVAERLNEILADLA